MGATFQRHSRGRLLAHAEESKLFQAATGVGQDRRRVAQPLVSQREVLHDALRPAQIQVRADEQDLHDALSITRQPETFRRRSRCPRRVRLL